MKFRNRRVGNNFRKYLSLFESHWSSSHKLICVGHTLLFSIPRTPGESEADVNENHPKSRSSGLLLVISTMQFLHQHHITHLAVFVSLQLHSNSRLDESFEVFGFEEMDNWMLSKLQCLFLLFEKRSIENTKKQCTNWRIFCGNRRVWRGARSHHTHDKAGFPSIPFEKKFCYLQSFLPYIIQTQLILP